MILLNHLSQIQKYNYQFKSNTLMVRLFEMFSGYGGASFSLKKAQISYTTIGYSEIDKMAIKCL